jgi:D-xylose transport system ATP-binding protein
LLRSLSVKIPSVRQPVASLSGGQRQSVAIARSLLGAPTVVILDEPTAALGVEQTANVLDLIEQLRQRELAVIVVSHNLADVRAVSDRIEVLRLGKNAGSFATRDATQEDLVAAITGVADNSVARRRARIDSRTARLDEATHKPETR